MLTTRETTPLTTHDLNCALLRVGARPGSLSGIQGLVNGTIALLTDGERFTWSGSVQTALARLATLSTARGRDADARPQVLELFADAHPRVWQPRQLTKGIDDAKWKKGSSPNTRRARQISAV